jgi:predicted dehydrogenase
MAADLADKHGMKPQQFARHQDLLALPGLDAVIITTPDHAHCAVLTDVVRAGKDAYVEKPLCARLEDAIAAHDLVKGSKQVVQVGTQRRSSPKFRAACEYVRSGALGPICKIETAWNRNVPSWSRPVDMVRPDEVDWEQYQVYLPKREFDPVRYRCWQLFYEHTTGLVGLLGSHMIDVALWFMDDPVPTSAVALGGNLTWKDGREIQRHGRVRVRVPERLDPDVLVAPRIGARDRLRSVPRPRTDARLTRLDEPPGRQSPSGGCRRSGSAGRHGDVHRIADAG